MNIILVSTLACTTCLLHAAIQASPQGDELTTEVIVSANRFAQAPGELLSAHTVINRSFIEQLGASSVFDVLMTVPGVQLARTGTDGSQTSIFVRGSNSNHTLVLLDGVRINTASEGAARLENIPVDHIERIEIVRGPQSSLYGADAIGGVIQIFTRQNTQAAGKSYGGQLALGNGTEKSRLASANLQASVDATSLQLDLSRRETIGIPPQNTPSASTDRAPYESDALSLRLEHAMSNTNTLWASWRATETEKYYPGGFTEASHRSGTLGARGAVTDVWTSQLQVNYFKDSNLNVSWAESRSATWRDSLQWQNELRFSDSSHSVVGVDIDQEELLYLNPGAVLNTSTRDNRALFGVYQHDLGLYTTTASVRVDDNQQFGSHTTGRLAVGRTLGEHSTVWLAAGTAFKAPTLIDLYVDFPNFNFFANPGLEPETARNIEVGLSTNLLETALSANIFRNDIRDLIGSDSTFRSLSNVSRARINGVEISAARDILGWQANLALTLLDHENRDTGNKLLRRPDEQMNLTLVRQFEKLSILFNWEVRSSQADLDPVTFGTSRVGGYGRLDASLEWQWLDALSLQLRAGNVFDKTYEVVDGYRALGRNAMLTARYRY
jgi:vitamin B12 transporter